MKKLIFTIRLSHQQLVDAQPRDILKSAHVTHTVEVEVDDDTTDDEAADALEMAYAELYYEEGVAMATINGGVRPDSDNWAALVLLPDQKAWYMSLPSSELFRAKLATDRAIEMGIALRTAETLLADDRIFEKVQFGKYRRVY